MKLSASFNFSCFVVLALSTLAAAKKLNYHPTRIAYADLQDDQAFGHVKASFIDALSDVGMVSITGIPKLHKNEVLSSLHACAIKSSATREHTFGDGTRRRTMATHTIPGPGGAQQIHHENPEACESFSQASIQFRKAVSEATTLFSSRLASILDLQENGPLLSTKGNDYSFTTIADVVENGDHLEHFHSYQKVSKNNEEQTIAAHTDQGLFLAFTPGLVVHQDCTTESSLSGSFHIELQDGSLVEVKFSKEDDLVFMLGDGVNQYVNPALKKSASGREDVVSSLRATPHALSMDHHSHEVARVWYGRMVLPPSDAVHPDYDGKTFGELRQEMIDASLSQEGDTEEVLSAGCSSNMMARQLEETTCEAGTIFCWHRCMNVEEHGVSLDSCAAKGLDLVCTNPRGQIYVEGHGDYYPGCIDNSTAPLATPYPTLPNYPRDDAVCTDAMFEEFASPSDYVNALDLGNGAIFMWNIQDGKVVGRLAFNGIFGYLAWGFANVGGKKNGMHGATVIMALAGGNYSAVDGLDLTMDPTIEEYIVDPTNTAFRHWMSPVSSVGKRQLSSYDVEFTDCFTAMTFKTDSIDTKTFNLAGSDELIWAANSKDYYAGYHGPSRGRFTIDWTTGEGTLNGANVEGPSVGASGALSKGAGLLSALLAIATAAMFYLI